MNIFITVKLNRIYYLQSFLWWKIFIFRTHEYSAIKVRPQFEDYLKTVKKSTRRIDSPSTDVVNI